MAGGGPAGLHQPGNKVQPREILFNTWPPSITELSPREKLVENDIIISSFGINCYRLRYAGNGAGGVTHEVPLLSPSPETRSNLAPASGTTALHESLPTLPAGGPAGSQAVIRISLSFL